MEKRKIISCSVYRGCIELLELKIRHLENVVDQFVIAEADYRLDGQHRDYTLKTDLERCGISLDKIKILEIKLQDIAPRENSIENRVDHLFDSFYRAVPEDSIIFVTDEDEIPSSKFVPWYAWMIDKDTQLNAIRLPLAQLSGHMNFRLKNVTDDSVIQNSDSFAANSNVLRIHTVSDIRRKITREGRITATNVPNTYVHANNVFEEAGWKFQWMGTNEQKLQQYLNSEIYCYHSELGRNLRKEHIQNYVVQENGQDPIALRDHVLVPYSHELWPVSLNFPHLKKFFSPSYTETEKTNYKPLCFDNGFSQIKVGSKYQDRIWVVEDFYDDPDSVREFALHQDFYDDPGFIGRRTRKQFFFPGLKERFEEIMRKKITVWEGHGMNGRFQYNIPAENGLTWHCDSQTWAGLIYLSPNAPFNSGTRMAANKKFRIRHCTDPRLMDTFNQKTFCDGSIYEDVDIVGNVYNRLVIYDGRLIHAAMQYFGYDKDTARLWHMFFFDAE